MLKTMLTFSEYLFYKDLQYLTSCWLFQLALTREGVSELWNELVKDGEVAANTNDGIYNSAGALAKKGNIVHFIIHEFLYRYYLKLLFYKKSVA